MPRMRVAIIDDDENAADSLSVLVEDAGLEAIVIPGRFADVAAAAFQIAEKANAALCDHRLSPRGYAQFNGANLVADLYDKRFPAVLVTQFLGIDQDVSIRKWRRKIPVLLGRDDADSQKIAEALDVCRKELAGQPAPNRKAWRSLIRVVAKDKEGGQDVLDAIIPAWQPKEAVRFPMDIIPSQLRSLFPNGTHMDLSIRLFAKVNIGAENARDLFLFDFERAPDMEQSDGLG